MKIKKRARKSLAKNPRFQAVIILDKVLNQEGYSNALIDEYLDQSNLSKLDEGLMVQLVYGVIQRRYTLEFYLQPLIKGKKVDAWVKILLLVSIYQMLYLDRIPQHAILNEAVQISKVNGHQALGNFVNAILRQFTRQSLPSFDSVTDSLERLSLQYSIEKWIIEEIQAQLSLEETEAVLDSLLERPHLSFRINTEPKERDPLLDALRSAGYEVEASQLSPFGIKTLSGDLIHSKAFEEGRLTVQDESSQLVAPLARLAGHERVLDACSAPGGKATHIAFYLKDGHLTALDISADKLKRVDEHAERLGLAERLTTLAVDALEYQPTDGQKYDRIYLDAPCSGLGLLRRKPELKYLRNSDFIHQLSKLQQALLEHLSQFLKVGGELIYSTCTLTVVENEALIDKFLVSHTDFKRNPFTEKDQLPTECLSTRGDFKIWPHQYHTDGFFISRLVRIN